MSSHAKDVADDLAVSAQLAAVSHQSDAAVALDLAIRVKAGWDPNAKKFTGGEPGPVTFRVKSTGKIQTSGHEHARLAVLSGVAELV